MKKALIAAAVVVVGAFVALRRLGPALGERAMARFERIFDRMPDDFPCKRMMRGLDEVREQNVEILRSLRELRERPVAVG